MKLKLGLPIWGMRMSNENAYANPERREWEGETIEWGMKSF